MRRVFSTQLLSRARLTTALLDRMARAGRQFASGRSFTGIAHAAGFSDSAHLSHTWQRRYGLSPSEVRSDKYIQAHS